MRRIVVTEFISIDGVVEDPGGAEGTDFGGWVFKFNDDEGSKYKLDLVIVDNADDPNVPIGAKLQPYS